MAINIKNKTQNCCKHSFVLWSHYSQNTKPITYEMFSHSPTIPQFHVDWSNCGKHLISQNISQKDHHS
jgi:hypothetical protein